MPKTMTSTLRTTPQSDLTPSLVYLETGADFVIPVVFPNYQIHVDDAREFVVLGQKIRTPQIKAPYLGHAGVLIINGRTGTTRYGEYGRYQGNGPAGIVRVSPIPDVVIKDDAITESSLKKALRSMSSRFGQSSATSGVVLRGEVFDAALKWLEKKRAENADMNRKPYDLGNHNCMTFVADLVDEAGLGAPFRTRLVVPNLYMKQFQLSQPDLEYDFQNDTLEISD